MKRGVAFSADERHEIVSDSFLQFPHCQFADGVVEVGGRGAGVLAFAFVFPSVF